MQSASLTTRTKVLTFERSNLTKKTYYCYYNYYFILICIGLVYNIQYYNYKQIFLNIPGNVKEVTTIEIIFPPIVNYSEFVKLSISYNRRCRICKHGNMVIDFTKSSINLCRLREIGVLLQFHVICSFMS